VVNIAEMALSTFSGYEISMRKIPHALLGSLPIRSATSDDLVARHAAQRRSGAAAWSIKAGWNALHGILSHAVRSGLLERPIPPTR
jgi:hypothetical protein